MTDAPEPTRLDTIAEARRQWTAHDLGALEAMSTATVITHAHQFLIAAVNVLLRPFGLTFSRYEALMLLRFSRTGALPLGKMGARLLVHPTSITSTIDRLERDGLVRRLPHPEDRRTVLAEITDDGRRVVDEATEVLTDAEFGVRALPPDVVAWLRRAVERLPAEAPAAS